MTDPIGGPLFAWVILPVLIFFARICDVSLGTIRVIFISKGFKYIAPVIGFFEVIIWLIAIGQVVNNITNVASYIAYGGGFATGTLLGMTIEERLSLGTVVVRVITGRDPGPLVARLRASDYGVTVMDAEGSQGAVQVIFMTLRRQDLGAVIGIVREHQPAAFYTIQDVRSVAEGIFPVRRSASGLARLFRKDK
jgi:uncharacterized protein YebE (UPF0316 family)